MILSRHNAVKKETLSDSNLERHSYLFDMYATYPKFRAAVFEEYVKNALNSKWSISKVCLLLLLIFVLLITEFNFADTFQ
jgi:hypothetical protein